MNLNQSEFRKEIGLSEIGFEKNKKIILENLKKYGIFIVDNFINNQVLNSLINESKDLIELENTVYAKKHSGIVDGKAVIIQLALTPKEKYPELHHVFNQQFIRELSVDYLGENVKVNNAIYCVWDKIGTKHEAQEFHFDIQNSLKFLIYLTDTDANNGAFSCIPGSTKITKEIRSKNKDKINLNLDKEYSKKISRELPVNLDDEYIVNGKMGTLIIFDTDTFHKAGVVTQGDRLILRSHNSIPERLTKNKTGIINKLKRFINS